MEKKLQSVFSIIEPKNKNVIWIHRKEGKLIQQLWGSKGWEDIGSFEGSSSDTDILENPFYLYTDVQSDVFNIPDYTKVMNPFVIVDFDNGVFGKLEYNEALGYEGISWFNHLDGEIQGYIKKDGEAEGFNITVSTYDSVGVNMKISNLSLLHSDYIGVSFNFCNRVFRGHIKWRESAGGLGIAYDVYGNSLPIAVNKEGEFSYNYPLYYNNKVVVYCNLLNIPESEIPSYYKDVNAAAFTNINKGNICILSYDWLLDSDTFMLSEMQQKNAVLKTEIVCVEKTSNECILLVGNDSIVTINKDGTTIVGENTGYVNPNTDIYSKYLENGGTKSKEEFYSKLFELIE